ncbi:MAG TPA: 16S rRNA (guanine(527)-N(7))-methyltransferase RsmG [Thermoanaerobaculia bacterium]|jgi:16S rRNA (guanine527-N7)-methyltransferase
MSQRALEPLPPERFQELLADSADRFGYSDQVSWTAVSRYLAELTRWRRSTNLTGDLSPEDLADHAMESVLGANLIPHGARVIDVGSGAGFPGLPIGIARPDLTMSLLEPRTKRAAFLRHVVRDLELTNTSVVESRAEEVGGQTFDIATVRAVGSPGGWLQHSDLLRAGGALLAWTTSPDELDRALSRRFRLESLLPVPGSARRVIAQFRYR